MDRRQFLAAAGGAMAACALRAVASDVRRPSLLIIHTDEHNYRTLGCYRATMSPEQALIWGPEAFVETPHIDSLAREGALFTRCFATTPVCTPSRATFVTGRYPHNTGSPTNDLPLLDDMVTFAEVLRREGYATGYAGKWHLDGDGKPQWAPERQFGFADNRFMFNRGHWKILEDTPDGPRIKAVDKQGEPTYDVVGADEESFTTDWLTTKALTFLDENKDKPFCYMLSIPDPHGPNTVRPPYDTMFDPSVIREPASATKTPDQTPAWGEARKAWNPDQMAKYFGMVKCIDDNVGRILDRLKQLNRMDDTILVFTSDHGDMCGEHRRHDKGVAYETSAGIPWIVRYPAAIRPGTLIRQAAGVVDFMPTVLSLMGAEIPSSVEGRDLSVLVTGGSLPSGSPDIAIMRATTRPTSEAPNWMAAVDDRYKLVVSVIDMPWLFDAVEDPNELTNRFLDPNLRQVVRQLASALLDYGVKFKDPGIHQSGVREDLDWAARGEGPYANPRPARVKSDLKSPPARKKRKRNS